MPFEQFNWQYYIHTKTNVSNIDIYMKRITISIFTIFLIISYNQVVGQGVVITLSNPSFEDTPRAGTNKFIGIKGWVDCGTREFNESPPDIHTENPNDPIFGVTKAAKDGKTYLGMVTRENESWESVSQKLSTPLETGKCYTFSIDLARSETYFSMMQDVTYALDDIQPNQTTLSSKPAVLRIWGGINFCPRNQLLAESKPVINTDWVTYTFEFTPNINTKAISLEAFYKTPVLDPYFGHILLDNASEIRQIPCPGDEVFVAVQKKSKVKDEKPPHLRRVSKPKPKKKEVATEETPYKNKILKDLNRSKLFTGKKININNLYFEANKSEITKESFVVLDEVVEFLQENEDVRIEVGGHTNGTPKHTFCDSLSRVRAKEVAQYLNKKGVKGGQLQFKGYGKRRPIADNQTKFGRKKNQRVEIKILSIDP